MAEESGEPKAPTFDWMPEGMVALADGEYDAIVLGTGLKECVIGGLLSTQGKRVLQIDRNGYYGSEGASLNLSTLYEKFNIGTGSPPPESLGNNRDYNIDLIPKFIMATGNMTKLLVQTKVTKYLEFKSIAGSFVYKDSKIHKIPVTPKEAMSSPLMGMMEKNRFRTFLIYIDQYKLNDSTTHAGRDLTTVTMRQLYTEFGLVPDTHQFISHAMCLQLDEVHMDEPALSTVLALQTYIVSLSRYGTSPYIYPLYGLGGLPEGFSRICAVHGGTFMLNQDIDEILFDETTLTATGVKANGNQIAKAPIIIGEPSYFPSTKVKETGSVVRCICLLDHPIPGTVGFSIAGMSFGTKAPPLESVQIVIPGPQVNRINDVFVCCVGNTLNVSAPGTYVAIVSTIAEVNNPSSPEDDINSGLALLGPIVQKFISVTKTYEPVHDGSNDKCYISKSFDGTSHFEKDVEDIMDMYYRITGTELDTTSLNDNVTPDEGEY